MNVPPARPIDALRLEAAQQLLARAGRPLPQGPHDAAWLQALIDGLCDLSCRDALTGLSNRRQFELALDREADRAARSGEPALLLLFDVDLFKSVNDDHGHGAGDLVLQSVARSLQHCVRPMDTVARYGGEEFAVVLPSCQPAFGLQVAERIRRTVELQVVNVAPDLALSVTLSAGGAFAPPWVRSSARLWLERADAQLYRAKAGGRNRTCLEPTPHSLVSAEEKSLLFAPSAAAPLDADPLAPLHRHAS